MHISPNNRNAIHPGDRILEINGTPVRTLRVEEVRCVSSRVEVGHGTDPLGHQAMAFAFLHPQSISLSCH